MRLLLIALVALLTLSSVFAWDPGPAPGVTLKNAILYLLTLGLTLRASLDRHFRIELPAIQAAFVALIIYAIASFATVVMVIDYPHYNVLNNALLLKMVVDQLLFFLVFFYGLRSQQDAIGMLKLLLIAFSLSHVMALLDALGIVSFGDLEQRPDGRVQGLVGESNQYGAFVAMSLPAILAMAFTTRGLERLAWGAATAITAITLVMTVSRGAFVAAVFAGVCAFFMFARYAPPGRMAVLAGAAVLGTVLISVAAIVLGFGELLYERVVGSTSTDLGAASSGRTDIWRTALEAMFEKPVSLLTGFGWRAYWSMPFRFSPHNHYLNQWFNLGMIGLVCSLFLFAWPIRTARAVLSRASPAARPALMGFITATIALATAVFFVDLADPWLYFWAYAGVAMRLAVAQRESSEESPAATEAARPQSARAIDAFGWRGGAHLSRIHDG